MLAFALRSMGLFFRDKMSLLMSLLAEIIILVLYIVFMRDNLIQQFTGIDGIEKILDVWMISGVIGITPVTASIGAYGVMVEDKALYIDRDFLTSPLGIFKMDMGYMLSAAMAGMIMSVLIFSIAEIYLMIRYGSTAGAGNISNLCLMILINSLCCAAMVILPVSFLKNSNSLAGCCTIFGALIGFMTGIYLPTGSLDDSAALIVEHFPVSHGVAVFRRLLTEPVISETADFDLNSAKDFMEYMGIIFFEDGEIINNSMSIMILMISAAVCMIITLIKSAAYERRR